MNPLYRTCFYLILIMGVLATSNTIAAELIGPSTSTLKPEQIIQKLKKGGYTVFFRHGKTGKKGEKEVSFENIDNCEVQRNLSSEGVDQTLAIGKAIKTYHIPIGKTFSSPYCRCKDTAKNIFNEFEKSNALFFSINVSAEERKKITAELLTMLSTPPEHGKNNFFVSHTGNLREATGIWPKPEGTAHVFQPTGDGNFKYVGEIKPQQW